MTLGNLSRVHLELGQVAEALGTARRAVTGASMLVAGLGAEEGVGARDPLAFLYGMGMEAALAADDPAQWAFFVESGRAGALLEGLQGREVLWAAAIPPDLRAAEARARAVETAALDALGHAVATGDRAAARAGRADLESACEQVSAAISRIQREAKAGAAILCPEVAALPEIRRALGEREALVLYAEAAGDAQTREAVAGVLRDKLRSESAYRALASHMDDPAVSGVAAVALGAGGLTAVHAILAVRPPRMTFETMQPRHEVVGRVGPAAVKLLLDALRTEEDEQFYYALDLLRSMGSQARSALPELRRLQGGSSDPERNRNLKIVISELEVE